MNKRLRTIWLMSAWAILLLIMVGCSKDSNSTNGNTGNSGGNDKEKQEQTGGTDDNPFAEHMDISVSTFNIGKAFPDRNSDEYLKRMEEKFNVTFVDKVISYSDYVEKFQLWSASGELPDAFSHDIINSDTYYSWIKQGIIRELPDDLSAFPNVQRVMNLDETKALKVDDKFYMIPRQTYQEHDQWAVERSLVVRKDWMDNLGLEAPVTYEDYLNMLRAFAKEDPDGNHKDDTVGLTFRSNAMLLPIATGTFANLSNSSWVKEDGKYIPYFASERMDEVVKQMRELYTEGAIDPDFAIMQTNDGIDKFGQGKVGAISIQATPNALKNLSNSWEKYNKDVKLEDVIAIIPESWANPEGKRHRHQAITFWSESYFSSKVDDKKMERILHIYDYLLSDEFIIDRFYGIEGKDYTKEGDTYTITREKNENGEFVSIGSLYPSFNMLGGLAAWYQWTEFSGSEAVDIAYGAKLVEMSRKELNHRIENYEPVPTNFKVELLHTPAKAKLSAINVAEDITRIMLAKEDPVAMWKETVKGYDNKGLQKAIEEVNEAVQAQGLDN
ncbi:extracellular solute-binding protein [Paenibacillus sp. J2TS4]|uniref:extracellular solute-binding protein n=1 Tax=Paenibacillus sp. J2TS4 TaxID=2807194 RepID=UPI001B1ECF6A|nr:extracellular solute-binding protein [Paenibacillus sp. J2TS4]GIP33478.1 putative ABC transporter peptide-binding protein YtcQ [Paenibacillus sp. J2TS4]